MSNRTRSVGSIKKELIVKAREAALCAIKLFNDPLITFKSESFIVLMIIAWTYLLHAHYRSKNIDYRYYQQGLTRKRYDRTKSGAKKHWELEKCLNIKECPIDSETKKNLYFLIGLRHEIEHQMAKALDNYLSGRYQACAFNFNNYIKKLFSNNFGLDALLSYSIQFAEIDEAQFRKYTPDERIPPNIMRYITKFDDTLSPEEYDSPRFSYRLIFTRKLVNRPGQADKVIEFIDPNSELAKSISKDYWLRKEVERPKYLAKHVVAKVNEAGFTKYRVMAEHLNMWKLESAKDPAKGYGVNVAGTWYWYDTWINKCIELCELAGDKYRKIEAPLLINKKYNQDDI